MKVVKHANELTPGSEQISSNAAMALIAPIPLPSLMDEEDAKYCLEYVADKVVTRAAKRKAEGRLHSEAMRVCRQPFPSKAKQGVGPSAQDRYPPVEYASDCLWLPR